MSHLYTTKVTAVGGRNGIVKSDDGILDLPLAMPKELGGEDLKSLLRLAGHALSSSQMSPDCIADETIGGLIWPA